AIWGTWARYVLSACPARFARFAVKVVGVEPQEDDTATAIAGIEAMEDFYREIHMPTSIKELGLELTEEQVLELAEKCDIATRGNLGAAKHLTREDMEEIFRMA
ncbi:MAG: iron-containing alcohol dehydrogenase, partial [Oscillospiraceae bacterium]|nr:iron-containing alcohol dehydrogenase [Oscillospiraceae bacterium]